MITSREFMGEEVYLAWSRDYEQMRALRNAVSARRPSEAEVLQLRINKPWETFYRKVLG